MEKTANQGRWDGHHCRLDGRQDWTEPTRVQAVYAECLRSLKRARSLAVDLRDVKIMDSKLVACLVAIQREAARRGGRITVQLSEVAARWLETCRVRPFLEA